MRIVTNVVALAVKVEKSNYKRLHSRSKLIEIKDKLFRDFGCYFRVAFKNGSQ